MKLDLQIDGREAEVSIERHDGGLRATIGEREIDAQSTWLSERSLIVTIDGRTHDVDLVPVSRDRLEVHVGSTTFRIDFPGPDLLARAARGHDGASTVLAPMPGKVVAVLVAEGDEVEMGSGVVVVEAMKMENEIQAQGPGRIRHIQVAPGDVVEGGAVLVEIE